VLVDFGNPSSSGLYDVSKPVYGSQHKDSKIPVKQGRLGRGGLEQVFSSDSLTTDQEDRTKGRLNVNNFKVSYRQLDRGTTQISNNESLEALVY